ncbi:sulfite reductase (NADPH) alpha subunit [Chromohalobacter marismortui]|uniref:Sulfite reductase [NADPH] flavoprotein alpha-component n=1 Tax=Chromohalobacter marismortui TaxID=42055 RepID=A0A4R7NLX1_9GAMM|nr:MULTISPECIES: assimilatory sulfite reductase (NADPH) flavoprotein subunit [Chromohalobacter]MCI0510181.1 assimilatory sulfite reductase (NADPH) flavoprotein subunit [Chromohalobacter sp.]MCI0594549.1 assimilatory sulfite reductase (NADPH) flavoprotein subunit [Chromohalobacter sp.]TDU21598.1 sulfite reductase (NADPH) alpha subunit [Chromohalobacter marismortui]
MSQGRLSESNSPLSADQARRLNDALVDLDARQRAWLQGYLAGLDAHDAPVVAESPPSAPSEPLTVLFGSQTGNAEGVAEQAAERARARGLEVELKDMASFGKQDLKQATRLMAVVSTQGDGDPPDSALGFYELLAGRKAPRLSDDHRFAVLGLGDASYEYFCESGKVLDSRLEALGAQRLCTRVDADVDYEETATQWVDATLEAFAALAESAAPTQASDAGGTAAATYSRSTPFQAEVLEMQPLNTEDSDKQTLHVELSLEESGLEYQPGDAVGIVPQNDPSYVDELLAALRLDGEAPFEEGRQLRDALLNDFEVTTLTRPFLNHWAEISDDAELRRLLDEESRDELREWLQGRHIIDVLEQFPVEGLEADTFIRALRKLPPRLYSIASSQAASPDEVHLTVAVVRYETHGRVRGGVATTYLADRVSPGDQVPIYIDHNKHFKLPDDDAAPIVMIGPGTGVAPFRAFLQEREARGASGDNWLFFGDRRRRSDFLYQAEWLQWRKMGLLTRLDVAFSRDQQDKVYVQDRLRERAATLYDWLQAGAYVFVCGDAERMAPDVHQALLDVIREQGGHDEEAAAEYLRDLQQQKRYQRDVY